VWTGNLAFAVGWAGTILFSPDGVNWRNRTSVTTRYLYSVAWSGEQLVAVGSYGEVLVSADGVSWRREDSQTTSWLYSVVCGPGIFIAAGESGTVIRSQRTAVPNQQVTTWNNRSGDLRIVVTTDRKVVAYGLASERETQMEVYTTTGRKVLQVRGVEDGEAVDVAGLGVGRFLLVIREGDWSTVRTISTISQRASGLGPR